MNQLSGKIHKIAYRHPILYYIRYLLIAKNSKTNNTHSIGCFNDINSVADIPQIFFEVNAKIDLKPNMDDFQKAVAIASYLRKNIVGGKGLGLSSENALKNMLEGKGGVCSDFSQIFNIFSCINKIRVKEWGCVDSLYKPLAGHSFNEFYSYTHQKWIAIDIHKSILFKDDEIEAPLSALELFSNLRAEHKIKPVFFSDYIPADIERIFLVYSKQAMPFVICNYNNTAHDYFLTRYKKSPPFLVNAMMILMRKHHQFVFVLDNYKSKLLPKSLQNISLRANPSI